MVRESKTKQCECISGRGKFFLDLELFIMKKKETILNWIQSAVLKNNNHRVEMHFKYRRQTVCRWQQSECPLSEEVDPSVSRRRWWLFVSFIGASEGHRLLFGQVLGCDQGKGGILASRDPMCISSPLLRSPLATHISSLREVLSGLEDVTM